MCETTARLLSMFHMHNIICRIHPPKLSKCLYYLMFLYCVTVLYGSLVGALYCYLDFHVGFCGPEQL